MSKIPWVFIHGALIWKIGLPTLTLLVALALRRGWRWYCREEIRRELARLTFEARGLESALRTHLRGTLRGGTLTTRHGLFAKTRFGGEPWLEHEGERVRIDPRHVHVEHGTGFHTEWWHPIWPRTDRTVADGDEVIIGGELARDERGWELRPVPRLWTASAMIDIHAVRSDMRPGAVGLSLAALVLGLIAAPLYGAMHHVGTVARDRATTHSAIATRTLADLGSLKIVAAMPGGDDALDLLARTLEIDFPHTEATFQLRIAVDEAAGYCPFSTYLRAVRIEEAVTAAERCGTKHDRMWTYLFAGRFADAARLLGPYDHPVAIRIAVALGHWDDAARELEAAADEAHEAPDGYDRCIVALFRAYGGNAKAFAHLSTVNGSCAVLKALALPDQEQAAALELALRTETLDRDDTELAVLTLSTTPDVTPESLHRASYLSWFGRWSRALWFAPSIEKAHRDDPRASVRDAVERQVVMLDILRGDPGDAQQALSRITNADTQMEAQFEIDLAGGDIPLPEANVLRAETAIRNRGEFVDQSAEVMIAGCGGDSDTALQEAAAGDGGPLAQRSSECSPVVANGTLWAALLPRVKTHRSELAGALRQARDSSITYSTDTIPFQLMNSLANYRTLSHLVGDDQDAERLQAVLSRHAAVLADPHKLLAFMLLTHY